MVKPGNTAKQGACSEPGPGEASGSIQLTLEEKRKTPQMRWRNSQALKSQCGIWREWTLLPASAASSEKRGEDAVPEAEQDPRGRVPSDCSEWGRDTDALLQL